MATEGMKELEKATTAFFAAILETGNKVFGHNDWVFHIDLNVGAKPTDADRATIMHAVVQQALDSAKAATHPPASK